MPCLGLILDYVATYGRARAEVEASRRAAELAEQNSDLERFVHVASHDLREPLRMVSSFTALLEREYGDRLDEQAKTYIEYAHSGARRWSASSTTSSPFLGFAKRRSPRSRLMAPLPFDDVRLSLKLLIEESDATVSFEAAGPAELVGDRGLVTLVLQNLVTNAIRYSRSGTPPVVTVRVTQDDAG